MFLYLPTFSTRQPLVPPGGLAVQGEPYRLSQTLADAEAAARAPDGRRGQILVLDADALVLARESPPATRAVPRSAVVNVDARGTYWRPREVEAAGGYVVRQGGEGVEVLLIFRRGVWDLPKGKLDEGETPEAGALREVGEEVGIEIDRLRLLAPLGPTVHGYVWPKKDAFAIKTTHWFAMATDAEAFVPQAEEDIEAVAWVPWGEAEGRLGFESLRQHVLSVEPDALVGATGDGVKRRR